MRLAHARRAFARFATTGDCPARRRPELQDASRTNRVALLSHPEMRALLDRVLRAYENGDNAP